MDSKRLEKLYKDYKEMCYADGGVVKKSNEDEDSMLIKLGKEIGKAFSKPPEPPKEAPEDPNERIRRQNRERMSGERPTLMSMDPELKRQGFAKGGIVPPKMVDVGELEGSVIAADPRGMIEAPIDVDKEMIESPYATEELMADIKSRPLEVEAPKIPSFEEVAPLEEEEESEDVVESKETPKAPEAPEAEESEDSAIAKIMARLKLQPQGTLDFGAGSQATQANLEKAQAERRANQDVAKYGMWGDLIGSGIAKAKPVNLDYFKQQAAYGETPMKEFEEKVANEKNDPGSSISKAMKQFIQERYGMDIRGNPSAADLERISKPLASEALAQLRGAYALMKEKEHAKSVADQIGKRGEESRKTESVKQGGREKIAAVKGAKTADREVEKDFMSLEKRLTSELASSRSAFGKAANINRSAEAIETLIKQMPNPNDLDVRQIQEIARNLDAMLTSGAATVTGTAKLVPKSYSGDAAKIAEYITSLPVGAGQGEFVKRMLDTVEREKQLATRQINQTHNKILSSYSHLADKSPDRYNEMLRSYGITLNKKSDSKGKDGKQVVKKGYNAKTNQTQFIYSDGSKEIKDGKL